MWGQGVWLAEECGEGKRISDCRGCEPTWGQALSLRIVRSGSETDVKKREYGRFRRKNSVVCGCNQCQDEAGSDA